MTPPSPSLPRREPIDRLPIVILYPHARCNCRCVMCDIWKEREPKEIAPGEVARWLQEWTDLGVERVVLSGGEPLMHSDLWAIAAPLRAAGIRVTLLSSGLLLARDAASIAAHVDDVIVSLDGPREVHDAIRNVPRAFGRLAEGVAALRTRRPGIAVTARCTVQRANFHHLRATVAAAREIGLDAISFLAADVSSEAFRRPGGWDEATAAGVALHAEDLPALAAELEALAAERHGTFVAESPEKLRARLLDHFRGDFAPIACNAPWVSAVIESDGTVRPCFFQPPLGNVREAGSLSAVLGSERAIAFRRDLDVSTDPTCRRCVCSLNLKESDVRGAVHAG